METATVAAAGSAAESSTRSKTVADLAPLAAERHADLPAVTYKDGSGQWVSKTYREVGDIVRRLALGLIELGIEKGDKVSILANTRPEWTYFDFAALSVGATVVPIYQTNSPEECQYVLENSDAKAVIVENDEQFAKIDEIRGRAAKLEHVIRMEGSGGDAVSMDELVQGGAGRPDSDWEQRWSAVTPDDICTIIYTSGTTGPRPVTSRRPAGSRSWSSTGPSASARRSASGSAPASRSAGSFAGSTSSPTSRCSRRSAPCSAGGSRNASPARPPTNRRTFG